MRKAKLLTSAGLVVLSWLMAAIHVYAEARAAEAILADLYVVHVPKLDRERIKKDKAYSLEWRSQQYKTWKKRQALILELYKTDPQHKRVPSLMDERWITMEARVDDQFKLVPLDDFGFLYKDIDEVINATTNLELRQKGVYRRAHYRLVETHSADLTGIHEYFKIAPQNPNGEILLKLAVGRAGSEKAKALVQDRIVKEFPSSQYAEVIKAIGRRKALIGKPLDLEFTDVLTGSKVSIKALNGKVVVLDFWATWCGPCIKEFPKMNALYEKYHGQGVEFIGVSLDDSEEQGGLVKVKTFLTMNKVPWPQYYQGDGPESKFSTSWGIDAIPAVFVVDQKGRLFSYDARANLEELISDLLRENSFPEGR